MDFRYTDEQELLLETVRDIMKRGNYEDYFKECDEKHLHPERACNDMVEAGFAMLGIPEEYGGTPCDFLTLFLIQEEASALGWPALTWVNNALSVDDILAFGNEEQKKKVLEQAIQGKKAFTLGFTEPQAGSDSVAISTTATRRNGKVYINGHKTFNTGANVSPWMLCMARDGENENPYKDTSMYLIPMDKPGITVRKLNKIGCHMLATCEVYLEDVEVEESDLVGKKGNGFIQLMKNFEVERLFVAADSLGMARCAYEDAVRYASKRVQFGKPIGDFQIIQEKLTDMYTKILCMQDFCHHLCWMKDQGMSIATEASLAKRYVGKTSFEVIDDAMQIMGGIGYTDDCRISRLWRDQRVYRIMAGTEEIMVHATARNLLKAASKRASAL